MSGGGIFVVKVGGEWWRHVVVKVGGEWWRCLW